MSSTEKIAITLDDLWKDHRKKEQYKDYTIIQAVHESLIINNVYMNQFDWEKYLKTYSDIIDESIMNEKDMVQDLVVAATNKALKEIDIKVKEFMKEKTGDILPNVPGFDMGNLFK